MRFLHLFIFFLFITGYTCAQVSDSAITTIEQNERWMNELEKLPMKEQVNRITKRLLMDTNVYARSSFPEEVRYSKNNGARPLYVIGDVPLYLCNIQDVKDVIKLTVLISEAGVTQLSIYRKEQAVALFGSRASAGVITMKMTDVEKEKLVQTLDFGTDCDTPYICGLASASQKAQLITTPEQNQKWLEELKTLPVEEQVKKINERLLNDISEPAKKEYKEIHPLYVIDGVPVYIDNSKGRTELANRLSQSENVSVSILDKQGMKGVILIQIKDKQPDKKKRRNNNKKKHH